MEEQTFGDVSAVTEETSWIERIKGALFGIIFGGILIFLGGYLLWNNEQDFIRVENDLILMKKNTNIFSSGTIQNGLFLISGTLKSSETLRSQYFGINASGALGLKTKVKMYQWLENKSSETSKSFGGSKRTTTTYSYSKNWSDEYHDASKFHSKGMYNPPMKYGANLTLSNNNTIQGLYLNSDFIENISSSDYVPVDIPDKIIKRNSLILKEKIDLVKPGTLYIGSGSYDIPNLGDSLLSFSYIPSSDFTIIAQKNNDSLSPYISPLGKTIIPIEKGIQSKEHMFKTLSDKNILHTWLFRLGGLLLIFLGFLSLFNLVSVLLDVIPFLGDIVEVGIFVIALILTSVLGGSIIAISWFYARPWYAAIFGGVIILIFYFLKRKKDTSIDTVSFPQSF